MCCHDEPTAILIFSKKYKHFLHKHEETYITIQESIALTLTEVPFCLALTWLERIWDARLKHVVKSNMHENQQGFRKGTSADDWLLAIRKIMERGEFERIFRPRRGIDTVPRELFGVIGL